MKTPEELQNIIEDYLRKYFIKIVKYSVTNCGCAWIDDRKIKVPKISGKDYIDRFMTTLHEIGHIVNGNIKPSCIGEYKAEQFAINEAKKYGIQSESYIRHAKGYVLSNIAEGFNRGLRLNKIPLEMKNWVKEYSSIDTWEQTNKKVFFCRSEFKTSFYGTRIKV